jgi:serine/threonine-protein kinase
MTTVNDDKTMMSADFAVTADTPAAGPPAALATLVPGSQRVSRVAVAPTFLETDRFIERELIGRGGMGSVIRAYDRELERDVAIKVLPRDESMTDADMKALMDEARITGGLEHPHIVPVYEFGCDERGTRFLCMKLVEGETLEDTLNWAGSARLEPDFLADLLQIFLKVCDAIAFAHSRGVLHRDLKPSNVMIGDFGQVYVVDWGVARTRGAPIGAERSSDWAMRADPFGVIIGTPRYMAPEQLHGLHDQLDERTDVFALGATLYQILTGHPPHHPDSLPDIALRKTRVTIPPPDQLVPGGHVPPELSRIAQKALSHDPEDRHASVEELKHEVERFQRGTWRLPRKWFSAGSLIVAEGEAGDAAYIIVEGRCHVFGSEGDTEVTLRELGPGDVFGETAIVVNKPRSASVRALDDVLVMVVTAETLSSALGLNRWMGGFVKALAERFRELDERVRRLERFTRTTRPPPPGE